MQLLILSSLAVFIFNIPFGFWRANVKKFSLQWVLAVHVPVPFIIALRLLTDLGFAWYTYVFLVGSFFLGQKLGGNILNKMKQGSDQQVSSCLFIELKKKILTKK